MTIISRNESLLSVNENAVVQNLFKQAFERKGYQIHEASCPGEALRIYETSSIDLVITGISFSAADGLAFLYDLKRLDPDVAVVVLAGSVDLDIAKKAISYGIYDLIPVPFELDQVVSSVRKACEKKMLLERNKCLIEKQASLIERIHTSYKKLRELDQLKADFLVTISHELLTPLTSIKALTYNLLRGILGEVDPKKREYLELIKEDADRLEEILKDILNFSKLEAGKITIKKEALDVGLLISKVVRSMRPVAQAKGITLEENSKNSVPMVMADRHRIEEILANLVINAIKFTNSGGRISVQAASADGNVTVKVQDTGIGISRDHLDKIFTRFTQLNREAGPGSQGVGLGLAIVKKLMDLHEGKIWVESELGEGTAITFSLPKQMHQNLGERGMTDGAK